MKKQDGSDEKKKVGVDETLRLFEEQKSKFFKKLLAMENKHPEKAAELANRHFSALKDVNSKVEESLEEETAKEHPSPKR